MAALGCIAIYLRHGIDDSSFRDGAVTFLPLGGVGGLGCGIVVCSGVWKVGSRRSKITWWAPRWSHVPRMWRVWRQLFMPQSILRVTIVSAVVSTVIIAGFKAAFPMLQLEFLWRMVVALPALFAYLFVMYLVYAAIPEHVVVRKDRIHIHHGQSNWLAKSDSIRATRIVIFAPNRIRLRIMYTHKGTRRSRSIGVGRNVDLEILSQLLPVRPDVWDLRQRYARSQRIVRYQPHAAEPE